MLMSCFAFRGKFIKNDVIQNANIAPITRKDTSAQELMAGLPIIIFYNGVINPQYMLAAIIAACPFRLFRFTA